MSPNDDDDSPVYCHRCEVDCTMDWYFFYGVFWCAECRDHVARKGFAG